eukprot:365482-Chlamydomonas_euryale.AAC.3
MALHASTLQRRRTSKDFDPPCHTRSIHTSSPVTLPALVPRHAFVDEQQLCRHAQPVDEAPSPHTQHPHFLTGDPPGPGSPPCHSQ